MNTIEVLQTITLKWVINLGTRTVMMLDASDNKLLAMYNLDGKDIPQGVRDITFSIYNQGDEE